MDDFGMPMFLARTVSCMKTFVILSESYKYRMTGN